MRPMKIEQLVQQSQAVLKHLRCQGENHDMLLIMMAWAQLATGMSFQLLSSPELPVPHLECEWWQCIRTGLASINAQIEMTERLVQTQRRAEDQHLMDGIYSCKQFTENQIRRFNACHLYLRVTLLSDISLPCGRCINLAHYNGNITNRISWPTIQYP
jgi:hypothetical protein